MTHYPIDLTEKQWQVIKKILDSQERKRKHSLREVMNAIRKSCSDLTNVRPSFRFSLNDGLWNVLSHGWRISEG